ncbi:MAG: phage tail sheath family protein [Velocimicrobium sp.]
MAIYEHGIISTEKATVVATPEVVDSAIGVIFGTAPVNLASDPYNVTNKPILAKSYDGIVSRLGYSTDFANYTLCQSIFARFKKNNYQPVVFVNVLDPTVHKEDVAETAFNIVSAVISIDVTGILLDTIVVKSEDGVTTYTEEEDYITSFADAATVKISIPSDSSISGTTVKIAYTKIDPSKVTDLDIIGGKDVTTGKTTGISCVSQVLGKTSYVPRHLLAPGWSQKPVIAAVLIAKAKLINGLFNAIAITDIDTTAVTSVESLLQYKIGNGYDDEFNMVCYPKVKVSEGYEIFLSAMIDCALASTDNTYSGPYASPSNKSIPITGMCKQGGEEIDYDIETANIINSHGIMTVLSMNGWRSWGNEMGCYPGNTDVKDRYIVSRRVFNHRDVAFKLNFFANVDDPTNYRLIETVVNGENKELAALATQGLIAGGSISYNADDNPVEQIMEGKIIFTKILSPFTPAKAFETETSFDPTLNIQALGGE